MGLYKYLKKAWKQPKKNINKSLKNKLIQFRREPVTLRIKKPTNLASARSKGYKAKQGIILIRQKVSRGGHKKPKISSGRRSKRATPRMTLRKSYQTIAEERANKKYKNCEVLNSYFVAKDGKNIWFEIILIDRDYPAIKKNKQFAGLVKQKGRVYRGKTSSSRKSRGLYKKGKGAEKARPSRRSKVAIRRKRK
ncbi:50S ribosomal protein L15e [Candidatus Woesearchaeota archaeon]|nr:50S ribosomal protein L15e [Candidatus Woesearchaeota archaeon]